MAARFPVPSTFFSFLFLGRKDCYSTLLQVSIAGIERKSQARRFRDLTVQSLRIAKNVVPSKHIKIAPGAVGEVEKRREEAGDAT
jgi:hypothetical protein